ncbi:MAG TPA: Xaa-Pro peptidase family protein [Thermomicrobiales bacterium]|nr:Xaa-Pro peptidase family protein [Thermomicrobiales bacterium]
MGTYERPFSEEEYVSRRERAVAVAQTEGMDGLVVWSRGGGTNDRHGNALYLANAYSSFPFVPDNMPLWGGRAHAVLILPVGGPSQLIVDIPYYDAEGVAVDQVRMSPNMLDAVADVLREMGLDRGRIGLVGCDVLPVGWYWHLHEALPELQWVPADHILDRQRAIKSPAEQALIREVAARGVSIMTQLLAAVEPGRTEGQVVGTALAAMASAGVMPYELHVAAGPDAHQYTRARMPGWDAERPMQAGEMFHVDMFASYQGYYFDFARTVIVGDTAPTVEQERIIRAARDAVYAVINAIRPGVTGRELAAAGYDALERSGLAGSSDVSKGGRASALAGFGHSLGVGWEGPWLEPDSDDVILPGMYLAVEKTVGTPGVGGASFEENLLVTEDGVEILTAAAPNGV